MVVLFVFAATRPEGSAIASDLGVVIVVVLFASAMPHPLLHWDSSTWRRPCVHLHEGSAPGRPATCCTIPTRAPAPEDLGLFESRCSKYRGRVDSRAVYATG